MLTVLAQKSDDNWPINWYLECVEQWASLEICVFVGELCCWLCTVNLYFSCEASSWQSGRGWTAGWCGEGRHYHQRMDGLLPLLWVHAEDSAVCERQVAGRCQ